MNIYIPVKHATLLLRQSSSLRQDPHRPGTSQGSQHRTRQVCVSNPQDKRNLLCEHKVIMNNHKPREALQHTQRWNISQIK